MEACNERKKEFLVAFDDDANPREWLYIDPKPYEAYLNRRGHAKRVSHGSLDLMYEPLPLDDIHGDNAIGCDLVDTDCLLSLFDDDNDDDSKEFCCFASIPETVPLSPSRSTWATAAGNDRTVSVSSEPTPMTGIDTVPLSCSLTM